MIDYLTFPLPLRWYEAGVRPFTESFDVNIHVVNNITTLVRNSAIGFRFNFLLKKEFYSNIPQSLRIKKILYYPMTTYLKSNLRRPINLKLFTFINMHTRKSYEKTIVTPHLILEETVDSSYAQPERIIQRISQKYYQ